ncbi:MAG: UMP kinase [Nanoarchaeota archaeon]|nr:UMP kinase [Nanoarchaeota archaeon]
MVKKVIVISLGGSQIIRDGKVNISFLKKFKKIILKHRKKFKFIIVCGGGSVARMYINGLKSIGAKEKFQNFAGISVTRTNARFMNYFFAIDSECGIPHKIYNVKRKIKKQDIVFCGALEYHENQTSDSTSAQVAREFKSEFINVTNVEGLYDKNPSKYKNAKLIKEISWDNFYKMASAIKFSPGQHFVLDTGAAKIILKRKIKTYIIGNNLKNLDKLLLKKKFFGTTIFG